MSQRAAIGLALVLAVGLPARAQEEDVTPSVTPVEQATSWPVEIQVVLGVGGRAPGRGFMPLKVSLTPNDSVTRTVTLRVDTEDGVELLSLGPAEVGGEARGLEGTISADALSGAGDLVVTAFDDVEAVVGQVVVSPEVTPHPILVVLDRRGAAPADLTGMRVKADADDRWVSTSVARVEDLPRSPLGWNGLGAALVGDLSLEAWGEPEARAFASWIERGGEAVISVGDRAQALRRSLVGRLLGDALEPLPDAKPNRVDHTATIQMLADRFGLEPPVVRQGTAPLARLLPGPHDEVLLRDSLARPLALRRSHGLGSVVLVGVDLWGPPFVHSTVTPALIEQTLYAAGRSDPRSRLLFGELAAVRQPAQTGAAFAVLITYALLVGPGIFFLLRSRRKGLLVWVAIPLIAVAATAVVPFYRLAIKTGESTLVGVLLREQRLGAPFAIDTADVLVFSGGLDAKELSYEGRDPVAFGMIPPPRLGRGLPRLGRVLGSAPDRIDLSLPIGLWGARYVGFESAAPPVRVTGRVELSPRDSAARLILDYDLPLEMRDAVIIYPTNVATMIHAFPEPLRGGAQVDQVSQPAQAGSYQPEGGELESALLHRMLFSRYLAQAEAQRRPFLVGAVDWPSPVRGGENLRIRTFAGLLAVELELGYRGGFPFGVASQETESRTLSSQGEAIEREVVTRFRFPAPPRPEMVNGLRLRIDAASPRLDDFDLSVWLADEQRWLPLDVLGPSSRRDPTRAARVTLSHDRPAPDEGPDVSRWIDGGELMLRQRFVRPAQGRDAAFKATFQLSLSWAE